MSSTVIMCCCRETPYLLCAKTDIAQACIHTTLFGSSGLSRFDITNKCLRQFPDASVRASHNESLRAREQRIDNRPHVAHNVNGCRVRFALWQLVENL